MKKRTPPPRYSTRKVIVGKTGTGKSHCAKAMIRDWVSQGVSVVVVDVCDEYSRRGKPRNGMACDGPLRNRVTFAELIANPKVLDQSRLELAVVPNDLYSPRAMARTFIVVDQLLREVGRPVVLVADECGQWTNSSTDPLCHRAGIALGAVATTGRKDGIALVTISQSAAHIPSNVRKQSDEWICFLQDDPADIEAMRERFGKDFAEQVSRLPAFKSLEHRDSTHSTTGLRAVS